MLKLQNIFRKILKEFYFNLFNYFTGMKKFLLLILLLPFLSNAQLTVNQIMRDPKWIGTSPSQIFWSYDNTEINFKWNPKKNTSDSAYSYQLADSKIEKVSYVNAKLAEDISNGKI